MAEVRGNQVQVPAPEIRASAPDRRMVAFGEGLAAGREWARKATQRTLDWIEGHPGRALLIAVGAGFVLGGFLFRPRVRGKEESRD
jgi:hypothetical protein